MIKESTAERRKRLAPVLAGLRAVEGHSVFFDLCEMLLMLSDDVTGSIEWDHPRVLVKIRQVAAARRIAKNRGVQYEPKEKEKTEG